MESPRHQRLAGALVSVLDAPAARVGLTAFRAVNVRLRPGRIVIPDLVVAVDDPADDLVVESSAVAMVGEVIASGEAAVERMFKAHLYAEAGMGWYLLAELLSPALVKVQLMRLVRLGGGTYVDHLTAVGGQPLGADSPVPIRDRHRLPVGEMTEVLRTWETGSDCQSGGELAGERSDA